MNYFVYLIQSIDQPQQRYVGFTSNLEARLEKHNEGGSPYTSKYKPWELIAGFIFPKKETSLKFEKYLKSHSGRAFAKKHF